MPKFFVPHLLKLHSIHITMTPTSAGIPRNSGMSTGIFNKAVEVPGHNPTPLAHLQSAKMSNSPTKLVETSFTQTSRSSNEFRDSTGEARMLYLSASAEPISARNRKTGPFVLGSLPKFEDCLNGRGHPAGQFPNPYSSASSLPCHQLEASLHIRSSSRYSSPAY